MRRFRTYADVAAPGDEDILAQVGAQMERLEARLSAVRRVVVVASGKGGVGKSAVAANLAAALASRGGRIGAVDADLNGPSLARMLGAPREPLRMDGDAVEPATGAAGVRLVSTDLLLAEDAPLRWRDGAAGLVDPATGQPRFATPAFLVQSTLEGGVVRELIADVRWGELDHLVIDAPPGSDRLVRLLELLPRTDLVLLVTTPAEITRSVVARSITTAREAGARRIALVGNMTGHVCEQCGHETPLYHADGARRLATDSGLELWAEIPFDPRLASATDAGRPFVLDHGDSRAGRALTALAARVSEA